MVCVLEVEDQPDAFFSRDRDQLFALRSAIPTKHQACLPSCPRPKSCLVQLQAISAIAFLI